MPGKRGRPPTGAISGKAAVFTTRIRPDLRAKLDEAAKKSGHSLSQEVEIRLSDSFTEEGRMEDVFGSPENYYLMRIVAASMQDTRIPYNKSSNWRTDPDLFDAVVRVVNNVLEALRPGPPKSKTNKDEVIFEWLVRQIPIAVWQTIQQADSSLPISEGTHAEHVVVKLKRKLGSIVDGALEKARAQMPDEAEWRRRADAALTKDLGEFEANKSKKKRTP
jgi:hypothetical protein